MTSSAVKQIQGAYIECTDTSSKNKHLKIRNEMNLGFYTLFLK